MNRSKGAAVLMLVGTLLVGATVGYVGHSAVDRARRSNSRSGSERDYRRITYEMLALDSVQQMKWDSLIDLRNRTVNEVFVIPRATADSIRAATREQQLALLTTEQRAKWDQWRKELQQAQQQRNGSDRNRDGKSKDDANKKQ